MSNSEEWGAAVRREPGQVQEWCPNCAHFLKVHGLNDCDVRETSQAAAQWQRWSQDTVSSRIDPLADECPRFEPFVELGAVRVREHWKVRN